MLNLIQPVFTLIVIGLTILLMAIIKTRFGLKLKNQKLLAIFLIIIGFFAISSSIFYYSEQWIIIFKNLQIFSLATIFSGIAAIGVITRWAREPLVYGTIGQECSSSLKVEVVPEGENYDLKLIVHNGSKVTANDIYVQASFPPQVKILNINSPVGTHIHRDTNSIELAFNTDKSYNPLHPYTYTTFKVKIKIEELTHPALVPVTTIAKNMPRLEHSFIISTKEIEEEKMKNFKKDIKLPLVKTREKYFMLQKIASIILLILGLYPWFIKYILPFLTK